MFASPRLFGGAVVNQETLAMQEITPQIVCLLDNRGRIVQTGPGSNAGPIAWSGPEQPATVHRLLHPSCNNPACKLRETWRTTWSTVLEDGVFTGEFVDPDSETCFEICVQALFPAGDETAVFFR